MAIDANKVLVYRMTHHKNLEYILANGIYYRNNRKFPKDYVNIGNTDIISRRDDMPVKCYPGTKVNDYIPFYFAIRTPMLYNIHTEYGVKGTKQDEVIYLSCSAGELTNSDLQWCFTEGNAAMKISKYFNKTNDLDKIDWEAVRSTDFRASVDSDRKRRKHAEFLVKDYVPVKYIKEIIVLTEERQIEVQTLVDKYKLDIKVKVDNLGQYYFP